MGDGTIYVPFSLQMISRNKGFYRDYFKGLKIINPAA